MSLIPFEYGGQQVRIIEIEGAPWFVLADLCRVLDLGNPSRVAERVDGDALTTSKVIDSLGRTQTAAIVSEAGMYEVVLLSRKPEAKLFRRWITSEVLPSIRKRGMYATPEATERMLADPDVLIAALTELKAERAARAELQAQREADAPKVLFADAVAVSDTAILVGDLAKILRGNGVGVGANRLFAWLRRDGYLIRREGSDWNMPTQRAMELGLFKVKETAVTHSDGHVTVSKTPKVTGKGQRYFVDRYLRHRGEGEEAA